MRKFLSLIVVMMLAFGVKAQTTAPDFNCIDDYGKQVHLYDILDDDQYAFLYFFIPDTEDQEGQFSQIIAESYYYYGANQDEVYFVGIAPTGDSLSVDWWKVDYQVDFPIIHKFTEGSDVHDICDAYGVQFLARLILIAPDRQIVLQDIWPVDSAQTIIDALAEFGIEEHECDEAQAPAIVFEVEREASYEIDVKFTPNASCASYYVLASTEAELDAETIKAEGEELTAAGTHTFTELTAETEYNIYALPVNAEGEFGEVKVETALTKCDATEGEAAIELNVAEVPGFIIADAFPNEATSEYHYAFVKVEKFEEWGEEYAIFQLLRDQHPVCGNDFWQLDIAYFEEGVEYFCYAIGYNADAELGEPTYVRFTVGGDGVVEVLSDEFTVSPNPAKSTVNVNLNGNAQVRIFDMTGRCVKEVNATDNTTINIEDLNKGVYFVNVNGKVEKLVVE